MIDVMNMSLLELSERIALVLAAGSIIIQISPIKLNPWTWVAKRVGRAINGEVIEKVECLEKDVSDIRSNMQEQEAKNNRTKILRFGDEVLHGVKHSKEHFDEILNCITEYDKYCVTNPEFKNHLTEATIQHITEIYQDCIRENSFL